MGARARDRWRRLEELLERGSARVTIDSFNIGLEVFVCNGRNFSVKLCEWLAEVGWELADLV